MDEDNTCVEWELQATEENVLTSFLKAFSFPDTITYQGDGYCLTKAYDTFWSQFYDSPACSDKHRKLPKPSIGNEKLKSLARIIKRGWQDERYLPTKFAEPFLRSCFFGKESLVELPAATILDFIEDDTEVEMVKKLLHEKENPVDDESLKVLTKYCSNVLVSMPNSIEQVCVIVVQKLLDELNEIIQEWNKELKGLLALKEFNFVIKERKDCLSKETPANDYDDLPDLEEDLPHRLWTTFFLGWSDDKIDFYFKMLSRYHSVTCSCGGFGSKHLMGNGTTECGSYMSTLRHDWVLDVIEEKLRGALSKAGTFFSSANDWTFLKRLESKNRGYTWPEVLDMLDEDNTPHLLVYSLTPQKKAMIVEVKVMWEVWYTLPHDQRSAGFKTKTTEFQSTVKKLEENGFEVNFKDIEMGCRGVLCRKLYELFKEDFKMEHGEISRTMEEVSKQIVSFPYEKYLCQQINDQKKEPSRIRSNKRKFED